MTEIFIQDPQSNAPSIYVAGIGGGGNNAVERMLSSSSDESKVTFLSINTDSQVLKDCRSETLQIGKKLTGGYGAGANPEVGEAAARESEEEIISAFEGANMAILTCGLGGGTGTGAIPVIAKLCKDAGILTVAVVTLPFTFESRPRVEAARLGLEKLKEEVDTLLVIPNDRLLKINEKQFYIEDAFSMADSVLKYTIDGLTNIIFNKGTINLDFNDIKTTLKDKGLAHLGIGVAHDGASLIEAVRQAIESPLLDTDISNASNILLNTSGRINLIELNEAVCYIQELTGPDTNIIWGTVTDRDHTPEGDCIVTLIATGVRSISQTTPQSGNSLSHIINNIGKNSYRNTAAPTAKPTVNAYGTATSQISGKQTSQISQADKNSLRDTIEIPEFLMRRPNFNK